MSLAAPISIFDSGVGGLSVAREIRRLLPAEELIYFADSAYCPYGGRPLAEILDRSLAVTRVLVSRGAKAIVVACNSASGAALDELRAHVDLPIVGMEPALKPAALQSRNRRVGLMATAATLQAERFDRLMESYARDVTVVTQACPGLVELVESGANRTDEVRSTLEDVLEPLRAADVDTVVLGCTHYPFLRSAIAEVLGPSVVLIDSGAAVARQTERVLREHDLLSERGAGSIRVLTSGDAGEVRHAASRLWQEPLEVEQVPA
jgi:glutamate racemase